MSLTAQVRTDAHGNIVIHMEGGLNYDNGFPLRSELGNILKENPTSAITLDMFGVDFVGSSGISHFVETIQILNDKRDCIRLTNVKTEFIKVFKLYNFDAMKLIIDEFESDETENLNKLFGNRFKTFQN